MKIRQFAMAILFGIGLMSVGANAAYISLVPTQLNDGSIDLPPAGFTAVYSSPADVSSIWFNANVSPQDPTSVANSITGQFGGTLTLMGQNDSFGGGNFSLSSGFDVLAIHLGGQVGGNELLIFFNTPITSFDIDTFSAGGSSNISNVRAYNTTVIPVPAALWLFGSGLIGLIGVARRKSSGQAIT